MKNSLCLRIILALALAHHAPTHTESLWRECADVALKSAVAVATTSTLYVAGKALIGYLEKEKSTPHLPAPPYFKKLTFAHVAGPIPDAIETIVSMFKNPQPFVQLNVKLPRGMLLYGPPGTGKTLLARAIAGELDCPFFYRSGAHFVNIYSGMGAHTVRALFAQARAAAREHPRKMAILFIDEIDAIGGKRIEALDSGGTERNQTLNQLLVEMDGFESKTDGLTLLVIGATNMVHMLDSALLRPGRFDELVALPLPDCAAREELLRFHARNYPCAADIDFAYYAQNTAGMSGAQLHQLVYRAAIHAAKLHHCVVHKDDFLWALTG